MRRRQNLLGLLLFAKVRGQALLSVLMWLDHIEVKFLITNAQNVHVFTKSSLQLFFKRLLIILFTFIFTMKHDLFSMYTSLFHRNVLPNVKALDDTWLNTSWDTNLERIEVSFAAHDINISVVFFTSYENEI